GTPGNFSFLYERLSQTLVAGGDPEKNGWYWMMRELCNAVARNDIEVTLKIISFINICIDKSAPQDFSVLCKGLSQAAAQKDAGTNACFGVAMALYHAVCQNNI